jgi:hypothetical protein
MGGCKGGGESRGTGGGGMAAVAAVRAVEETEGSVKEAEKMEGGDERGGWRRRM